jgi:hypothetical protein
MCRELHGPLGPRPLPELVRELGAQLQLWLDPQLECAVAHMAGDSHKQEAKPFHWQLSCRKHNQLMQVQIKNSLLTCDSSQSSAIQHVCSAQGVAHYCLVECAMHPGLYVASVPINCCMCALVALRCSVLSYKFVQSLLMLCLCASIAGTARAAEASVWELVVSC